MASVALAPTAPLRYAQRKARSDGAVSDAEIAIEPVRGHPTAFHFSFATHDGEITGRASVAIEGKSETRSSEEKLRAAKIKVEHLVNAAPQAVAESVSGGAIVYHLPVAD